VALESVLDQDDPLQVFVEHLASDAPSPVEIAAPDHEKASPHRRGMVRILTRVKAATAEARSSIETWPEGQHGSNARASLRLPPRLGHRDDFWAELEVGPSML
jgi:hypothetical protein